MPPGVAERGGFRVGSSCSVDSYFGTYAVRVVVAVVAMVIGDGLWSRVVDVVGRRSNERVVRALS